jgi:hypothetical protein
MIDGYASRRGFSIDLILTLSFMKYKNRILTLNPFFSVSNYVTQVYIGANGFINFRVKLAL